MPTRSIGVSGICKVRKREFEDIMNDIKREFDDEFIIEQIDNKIWVRGDLHNYKTRYRLHEIITGEKVSG